MIRPVLFDEVFNLFIGNGAAAHKLIAKLFIADAGCLNVFLLLAFRFSHGPESSVRQVNIFRIFFYYDKYAFFLITEDGPEILSML